MNRHLDTAISILHSSMYRVYIGIGFEVSLSFIQNELFRLK